MCVYTRGRAVERNSLMDKEKRIAKKRATAEGGAEKFASQDPTRRFSGHHGPI